MKATVFLGGGRITTALIAGLRRARYRSPIVVHDRHPERLRWLRREYSVLIDPDLHHAVEMATLLIIAVRPDSVPELLERIGKLDKPLTAVSLAAGIPLANFFGQLGRLVHWSRAMPSPAARFGRGLTATSFPRGSPKQVRARVNAFFAEVGQVVELPESRYDAFTVTYSCSHGYHALATLAGAAERLGLNRKTALLAAAHALGDGILSWREGKISLPDLLHEAATPGGIAADTMSAMDDAGYKRAVERGVRSGLARTRRNARILKPS
jgi:pyrroline-5-carboxylate reductase